ncbi:MAG: sigma-70 family RNA polymerase sigma factor [Planctomycetota bacterium]
MNDHSSHPSSRARIDDAQQLLKSRCGEGADLALVRRVLAGQPDASRLLLDRLGCLARFLGALNQRSGSTFDDHEIADVVQDTLIVVWRKLASFRGPDGLESWVLRIARFEFQNARRKKARRAVIMKPIETQSEAAAPGDHAGREVERQTLAQVLGELDPKMSQTIELKHFDGLTFDEIGERMGCSANTAKTRYYRGLVRLADALEGTEL